MASRSSDVEILVHVAAPSRTADDVVYRQLAQAYLSFQPEHRAVLPQVPNPPESTGDEASVKTHGKTPPSSSSQAFAVAAAEPVFGPDSQDLSFQSAFDNRSSPLLRPADCKPPRTTVPPSSQTSEAPAQSSFCAPASQISDSYPLPDSGVMKGTPTRILQQYLKHPDAPTGAPASPSRGQEARRGDAEAEVIDVPSSLPLSGHGQEPDQAQNRLSARKVIPVTPVAPLPMMRKRKGFVEDEDQSAFDITHVSSSVVSHPLMSSPSRAESEPLPLKWPKTSHDSMDSLNLARSSSDTGPIRSSDVSAIEHIAHTLEIRPPSPPTGIANIGPSNFISGEFAKLAHDLSARYRPKEKRPLDPLERGYWLLDCTCWSPQTRLDAWVFLTNYLRSGLAGWGVWCRRDAAHAAIRLYGWGCVAKNTYLLLYLASGRQVKTTGARWFGADGDVVLEVPPRERRT
ncbi:hypothetical protein TOPH_05109 [Tolypocladium ophioglossoides CBS 100239]|uniref:Uncharacterized protein n=1 Tax=Tolypocladium ophioglossoides (strain CBS 100239) TaxID=1163406 RepID=A0A0L0N8A1_TOLOC|nr:hypothetical protein TOPH_05109 [Tolypocladium ophioglossoides CBS 100239]